jgi:hypothetical protein
MGNKISLKSKDREYLLLGIRMIGVGGIILALPVVLFVLVGQWLDERYARGPTFTITAFVLAALLSGKMIYRKAREYGKEYESIEKG